MMDCVKCFTDGYQRISAVTNEDDDIYTEVKQDLDRVVLRWKDLEKETRQKVIEINNYFKNLKNSKNDEAAAIRKAQEFGKVMKEYSTK